MKMAGIIGGIAPESTIEYYRGIIARYRQQKPDGTYPPLVINSIDLTHMIGMIGAGDLDGVTGYLTAEVTRLAAAGAAFAVFASNTPHIVFDRIAARTPIPMLSIVEATRDAVSRTNITRLALFGTRFTMQGGFYRTAFAARGLTVVLPTEEEQAWIHDKYMNELVAGTFLPATKDRLTSILARMRRDHAIEAVILGGTELPLILREPEYDGVRVFDTTAIHVERIVEEIVG